MIKFFFVFYLIFNFSFLFGMGVCKDSCVEESYIVERFERIGRFISKAIRIDDMEGERIEKDLKWIFLPHRNPEGVSQDEYERYFDIVSGNSERLTERFWVVVRKYSNEIRRLIFDFNDDAKEVRARLLRIAKRLALTSLFRLTEYGIGPDLERYVSRVIGNRALVLIVEGACDSDVRDISMSEYSKLKELGIDGMRSRLDEVRIVIESYGK